MIGAHHLDLPEPVHERIALGLERIAHEEFDVGASIAEHDVREGILLKTCARSELYFVTRDPARAFRGICSALAEDLPLDIPVDSHLRFATSAAAARHLFRTASGLESALLGEAEVLGQVRDALKVASAADTAGPLLQRLFQDAIEVGRRVRTETEIGRGSASLASTGVEWAEGCLAPGEAPVALVLGAGRTARAIAHRLTGGPWSRIHIANRTAARACSLAEEVGGRAHTLAEVQGLLPAVDAVFAAVGVERPLVGDTDLVRARAERSDAARIVVDLSHPHAIERTESNGIEQMDLATLQHRVREDRAARARWIPEPECLVDSAVESYVAWVRGRGSVPLLVRLRERVLDLAMTEAERAGRGRSAEEREEFRRLARSIARTVLHEPTLVLRSASGDDPAGADVADVVSRLFDLDPSPTEPDLGVRGT